MNAGEHSSNYKSSTFLDPAGRRPGRSRKIIWAAWIAALSLIGLGISPGDETALRQFSEAVRRWQIDPEFRKAAGEYCSLGSAATRTRFIFIPTGRVVMAARSVPFLPRRFAVNPTSQSHYDDFDRGPLCAYLHLCNEQSVGDVATVLEQIAREKPTPLEDSRLFLDSFKMDFPVVEDTVRCEAWRHWRKTSICAVRC